MAFHCMCCRLTAEGPDKRRLQNCCGVTENFSGHVTSMSMPAQVSNEGDVLYVLPKGFRGAIAARSWRLRAEPVLKKVRPV